MKEIDIDKNTDDVIIGYVEDIRNGLYSYENVEQSCHLFDSLINQFNNKLIQLKDRGLTSKLWIQYRNMVQIAQDFIYTERLGNWNGHLDAVKKIIPYFNSAGHFFCTKSRH